MTGMPTDALDLHDAAIDDSETPATAFNGVGLGAGLNQIIADAEATGTKVGPGTSAPARGKALVGTGVTSGSGKQQSIWDRHERRNLIVNGTGRTKQRTTLPTTDNSYAIDRMRLLMENANGFTITQETTILPTAPGATTGYRFTVGSGNNGKGGGFWPVVFADMAEVAGGVLSLQCQLYISHVRLANLRMGIAQFTGTADAISGDPVSSWGADGTNPTLAANWSFADTPVSLALAATTFTPKFSQNVSISSSAKNIAVIIWNDARTTTAADFFIVTDIQLERGAVCTAVERAPEPLERLACRDWYRECGGDAASQIFGVGSAASTTVLNVYTAIEPMRAVPAVAFSAAADFAAFGAGAVAGTGITALNVSKSAVQVQLTMAGGLTARESWLLLANSTTNARIKMTAEP